MGMGQERLITRRGLIKAGAGSAALLASPMIMRGIAAAQENILYVNTYGGTWTEAEVENFYKPFTAKTGIKVQPVLGVNLAKVKAVVQTKNYDFDTCSIEFYQAKAEKLVEPLDRTALDMSAIPPGMLNGDAFKGVALSTVMAYRKDKFPNGGPRNWADFWDVKRFPGRRALNPRANIALQYALLADGVPYDKVYPLDLDRAFKKLDEIKEHITVWWTTAVQSETLMKDGEVDIMSIWSSRGQALVDEGHPVQLVWEGADLANGSRYVVRGTPRAKNAFKFMETYCDAKNLAGFCERTAYGSPNPDSLKYMTKEQIAKSPSSPEHLAVAVPADEEWLTPRIDMIKERFTQWMAG